MLTLTTIAERPDLADPVGAWLWQEWGRKRGRAIGDSRALVASRTARVGPDQCFVVLRDGLPVATASFTASDLDGSSLHPWLASVYVDPAHRGIGLARLLVASVEGAAREAGFARLWLFTAGAAGLYGSMGWIYERLVDDRGQPSVLMRRDLHPEEFDLG